jgi:hypothetical protein
VELRSLAPGLPVSRAVSDADGRLRLDLPVPRKARADAWLAAAVVLEPPAPGSDAEWRSVWTSLTFERGSP